MTNHDVLDHGAPLGQEPLGQELLARATLRARRRPVKIVEHPAFRAGRPRAVRDAPLTVLRLPVVSLNRGLAQSTSGGSTSLLILGAA